MHPPQEEANKRILLATSSEQSSAAPNNEDVDEDWEEWDGKGPFWVHCVAGSIAGVAEHTLVYPLDTVRTHIQVCASCVHRVSTSALNNIHSSAGAASSAVSKKATAGAAPRIRGALAATATTPQQLPTGMWQTMRFLMNEPSVLTAPRPSTNMATLESLYGMTRLWRGVESILLGCIPAHALYFSVYETLKAAAPRNSQTGEVATWASSLTGAAATLSHDMVMTPLDTVKQRMQLGHYQSTPAAIREICQRETYRALYRSFPITLITNLPYGMVFMPINDHAKVSYAKQYPQQSATVHVLMASSTAGFVASAVTTPLDRIKTALQTQTLAPACLVNPAEVCTKKAQQNLILHDGWQQAAKHIYKTEGWVGFWRGLAPRVLSHTPALAISWTTYEMAKNALMRASA